MAQSEIICSPVGRFVSGSLTEMRTVNFQGLPIPEEKQQYEMGVAFRKDDPAINVILQAIAGHAFAEYAHAPQIQQIIQAFDFGADGFSWKISDGDKPNKQGAINSNAVGCWVIYFKTQWIKCANQQNAEIPAADIKRGYFVDLLFNVATNGLVDNRAGVYINPQIIRLVAFGDEIVGGIDPATAFANHPVPTHLPPGASMTPTATQPAMPIAPQPTAGVPVIPPAPGVGQAPGIPVPSPQMPGVPTPTASPGNVTPHPTFAGGPVQNT